MTKYLAAALAAIGIALPGIAAADTVNIPLIRIPATVSGTWVLNPRACPDLREDVRDARRTTSYADLREDRRDQRIVDCPVSAWSFVATPGAAPSQPIRIGRDGVARFVDRGEYDRYRRDRFTISPRITVQPTPIFPRPSPVYTPGYQVPVPHRAPQPATRGRYEIRNGQIIWLD